MFERRKQRKEWHRRIGEILHDPEVILSAIESLNKFLEPTMKVIERKYPGVWAELETKFTSAIMEAGG